LAKTKGEEYKCDECGLVVTVSVPCECDETCELECCEEPMKKTSTAKTEQKAKA
jgi:hypothetical protein